MAAIELNNKNFESETIKGDVIIDFFATWCGPCRMMAPIYDKLAHEFPKIKFCFIDIDKNSELAQRFDVFSVPTFLFLKNGKEIDRIVGGMDYSHFKDKINSTL